MLEQLQDDSVSSSGSSESVDKIELEKWRSLKEDLGCLSGLGDMELRNIWFQKFIYLLEKLDYNSDTETTIFKKFIKPIRSRAARILSDKQMGVVHRYLNSLPNSVSVPRVCYTEWQPSEDFHDSNVDVDSWYRRLAVTEARMVQIMDAYEYIRECLKANAFYLFTGSTSNENEKTLPENWDLLIYGSVTNGLCQEQDSDLDLTLVVNDFKIRHDVLLRRIRTVLQKESRFCMTQEPLMIQSGCLLSFRDELFGIEIDVSINKVLEIANSQLINAYSHFDERFRKLALVLKSWNKQHFPDRKKRLNSFSIILLLIAFLQHRKILPNLQALATERQLTRFQVQTKDCDYEGETDTSFVKPDQFSELIDLPAFLDNPGAKLIKQAGCP